MVPEPDIDFSGTISSRPFTRIGIRSPGRPLNRWRAHAAPQRWPMREQRAKPRQRRTHSSCRSPDDHIDHTMRRGEIRRAENHRAAPGCVVWSVTRRPAKPISAPGSEIFRSPASQTMRPHRRSSDRTARKYTAGARREIAAIATRLSPSASSESAPSCIRAPPDATNRITGVLVPRPHGQGRDERLRPSPRPSELPEKFEILNADRDRRYLHLAGANFYPIVRAGFYLISLRRST